VGGCRGSAVGRNAGLKHNDGLLAFARGFNKRGTVTQALDVQRETVGIGVVAEVADQFRKINIRHIADGNHLIKAHAAGIGGRVHGDEQRAALGDQRGFARQRQEGSKRCVHFVAVGKRSHDVGTQNAHPIRLRHADNFVFEFNFADFSKTRSDDDQTLDAFFTALFGRLEDEFRGHCDHCRVHHVGDIRDSGIAFETEDFNSCWVDRVNAALVFAFNQVADDGVANFAWSG